MTKVNFGILGAAAIANKVIESIDQSKNGKVLAIASRDIAKAEKVAKTFNIQKFYGNYDQLLEDQEIDAIYIPLPNQLHKEWTVKAAMHSKHVLCEKPFALTQQEAEEMFESGEQQKVKIMEAFMYRFDPKIAKIKKILDEGTLGDIKYIDFTFAHTLEEKLQKTDNYRLYKEAGGGSLYDIAIYGLSLVNYLLDGQKGELVHCRAVKKHEQDIDRSIFLQVQYGPRILANITSSFQFYVNSLQIGGSKGELEVTNIISQEEGELRIRKLESKEIYKETLSAFNSYTAMVDHFTDCIQKNENQFVTKSQTLEILRLVEDVLSRI